MYKSTKKIWLFVLMFILTFTFVGCKEKDPKNCDSKDEYGLGYDYTDLSVRDFVSEVGIVTVANPYAAKIGIDVLLNGGNAFDAAVAVSFALGVVEPNASGLGGGGILVGFKADTGEYVSYNFLEFVPKAGVPSAFPNLDSDVDDGPKSSGVPTQVAGLLAILAEQGTMSRQEILNPVIKLAKEGVKITPELAQAIQDNFPKIMRSRTETQKVFSDGIFPLREGDLLKQEDLAWVLEQIRDYGLEGFYKGEVANRIVELMEEKGGLITHEDLEYAMENYPIKIEPLHGTYRGYDIITVNSPSSGGQILLETLNMLEVYGDVSSLEHNSAEYLHLIATLQQLAYGDKRKYFADTKFVEVPINGLISKLYAAERFQKYNPDRAYLGRNQGDNDYGNPWPYDVKPNLTTNFVQTEKEEHYSTTSFSVADKDGNIVSVTQTINYFFGNGLVPRGCGFFMNNELSSFSFTPSSVHYIQPLKQPVSHIMPTIIMKDGEPFATIGSPGGLRIPAAVIQVVVNIIDFNMDIQTAISKPRIYCYAVGSDETYTNKKDIYVERGIPESVRQGLVQKGYNVIVVGTSDIDLFFGGAQGIRFNAETGEIHGGADPRRDGKALGILKNTNPTC